MVECSLGRPMQAVAVLGVLVLVAIPAWIVRPPGAIRTNEIHSSSSSSLIICITLAKATLFNEDYKPVNSRGHYDSAEIGEIGG